MRFFVLFYFLFVFLCAVKWFDSSFQWVVKTYKCLFVCVFLASRWPFVNWFLMVS